MNNYMDHNFGSWLNTQLGRSVVAAEAQVLNNIFTQSVFSNVLIFGNAEFYLMPELFARDTTALDQSKDLIYYLHKKNLVKLQKFAIDCHFTELSIGSDCIDLVILPHTLEMVSNPCLVLTEVYRVLRPEGRVVITGFNLWSVWGFYRLICKLRAKNLQIASPWVNDFYSTRLLLKWLTLLGFKCNKMQYYYYNLPINNVNVFRKLNFLANFLKFLPLIPGNVYTLVASKNMVGLTPVLDKNLTNILVDNRVI